MTSVAPQTRSSALGLLLVAILLLGACSTSEPPAPASSVPVDERPFVVDPLVGYPLIADPIRAESVRAAYASLARGATPESAAASARTLLEAAPEFHPARVLLAQTDYLAGRPREAAEALEALLAEPALAGDLPYTAASLLLARSRERLGEIPLAYARYRDLAATSTLAAERADALRERAWEIVSRRFEDALERGRLDAATGHLARLRSWLDPAAHRALEPAADPSDPRPVIAPSDVPEEAIGLLDAERRLLEAKGDRDAELAVLSRLVDLRPTPERIWRRGDLELDVGDVRAGLELFEALAADRPESLGEERLAELPDRVAAARFLWKIELLPPAVRELSRRPELDRAGLASLLYWLLPGVRFAEVDDPPIAADILEHESRREILSVLDQGLLGSDRTRHRFLPDAPATRLDALAAVLTFVQSAADPGPACLDGELRRAAAERPRNWVCQTAARCGLIGDPLDCLPAARVSGREALDLVRRGLEALEAVGGSL